MKTTENKLLFIVEDDPLYSNALSEYLTKEIGNLEIKQFSNGESCLHEMYLNPLALIIDYYLDSQFEYAWNGIQILKKILISYPSSSIIIISVQNDLQIALNCVKNGALDYVIKNEKTFQTIQDSLLNVIDDQIQY